MPLERALAVEAIALAEGLIWSKESGPKGVPAKEDEEEGGGCGLMDLRFTRRAV